MQTCWYLYHKRITMSDKIPNGEKEKKKSPDKGDKEYVT